jgi:hypothetical protein
MPDFRHFCDTSLQEIVSSRKSWYWIFLQFLGITFAVAGRNMWIAFHFRIPSQDQIVYMTKGSAYIKDLMLNHTFQVIWKTFAELHYSEKVTAFTLSFDIQDIKFSTSLIMSYVKKRWLKYFWNTLFNSSMPCKFHVPTPLKHLSK